MQRIRLFFPLVVFAVMGLFLLRGLENDPTELPSALEGNSFPDFYLESLDNPDIILNKSLLSGKVSLINVWATWCVACRAEHPFLIELQQQGLQIVGVNYKDSRSDAQLWLKKLGNPYIANIFDREGALGLDLGVYGAPENFLVDESGIVQLRHAGVLNQRVWSEKFKPLIERLGAE